MDDPLKNLMQHINFLKRCSQLPAKTSNVWSDAIEEPQSDHHGLHPGLFAAFPVDIVSKETNTKCSECQKTVKVGQATLKLSCGHTLHHECGRAWFLDHSCCPSLNCGKIFENSRRLEKYELASHVATFSDIMDAIKSALPKDIGSIQVEYDGLSMTSATETLRACKGIAQAEIVVNGRASVQIVSGPVDEAQLSALIKTFYQGSVIVKSTIRYKPPVRIVDSEQECESDMPETIPIVVRADSRQHGGASMSLASSKKESLKKNCLQKTRAVLKRFNSGASSSSTSSNTVAHQDSNTQTTSSNNATSSTSLRRRFPKVRSSGRLPPFPKEGFDQEFYSSFDQAKLQEESDRHSVNGFVKIVSFTVKSGCVYQRTPFQTATTMCSGRAIDPAPRTIYM